MFHRNLKKIELEPAITWKLVTSQRISSKIYLISMESTLEPAIRSGDTGQRVPCFDSFQLIKTLIPNMCALSVFLCSQLAKKYEIEHCSRSSKTINWSADRFQVNRDELTHEPALWSWDTGQLLSCFDSCQLNILWMFYIKDVDLPRHAGDTPPFLLIVSPTPPIRRRGPTHIRSVNHVTTKRKEVDHIPRA